MKKLSEKQVENRLKKYYLKHYGECGNDNWYVNPNFNKWKFERNGQVIILIYDVERGEVIERKGIR